MKKILIVDDDQITLKMIEEYLSTQGYDIDTSIDGFDALDKIKKNKYNLIISDIMMPELSGLSLLSLLKTYYFDSTPVLFISSLDSGDLISKSLGLGADDFMIKPLDLEKLSNKLELLLNK